ncbi:MAG TPA: nicotinate-nucleotide adenylyltransferase [Acidimicrobiales bacterium]|nr:nicotinate-nucleotide adenylyltransferase [Acidimicrobiales bacterium]
MRIGIFGGTFDPVHVGHLVVVTTVHHALGLDETRVVVAGDPWQKAAPVSPGEERVEMARAAVDDLGVPGIVVDDCEVRRGGRTYTIETLEALRAEVPGAELYLAIGNDAAKNLPTWHRADELPGLVTLALVNRPGAAAADLPGWRVAPVDIPYLDVSSSLVRARLAVGLPVDGLVPAAAMRVVRNRGRYSGIR